ncbi:hypothetical protein L208DRAFT_665111 [Tricholoma matsutake]|nr:hypothetical protein L208DRAFT_665111 [Tricholoma matsutake 945]
MRGMILHWYLYRRYLLYLPIVMYIYSYATFYYIMLCCFTCAWPNCFDVMDRLDSLYCHIELPMGKHQTPEI